MEVSNYLIANTHNNVTHESTLEDLIKSAKFSVKIICPFISKSRVEWLEELINDDTYLEVITELTSRGIASGVQSPSTLKILNSLGAKVSYLRGGLHAKVFIIDNEKILITSANLTNNGLRNNFELGVLFEKERGPFLAKKVDYDSIKARVNNLWNYLKNTEVLYDEDTIEELIKYETKTKELRNELSNFKIQGLDTNFKNKQSDCMNLGQVDIELQAGFMFKGFDENDWGVFDHGYTVVEAEKLIAYKNQLTLKTEPVLKKFYNALRHANNLSVELDHFNEGYSKNRFVKLFYPNYRYLWLAKKDKRVRSNNHIGIPTYIFGMGNDSDGNWFEIRTGVEELNEPKITEYGLRLMSNMKNNINECVAKLSRLDDCWEITHEKEIASVPNKFKANETSKERLLSICNYYINSEKISDFHIRKTYFFSRSGDNKLLTTSKLMESVTKDIEALNYFFNLSHR